MQQFLIYLSLVLLSNGINCIFYPVSSNYDVTKLLKQYQKFRKVLKDKSKFITELKTFFTFLFLVKHEMHLKHLTLCETKECCLKALKEYINDIHDERSN
jgi:hypothetical protein